MNFSKRHCAAGGGGGGEEEEVMAALIRVSPLSRCVGGDARGQT
jgi:hypothetical protein